MCEVVRMYASVRLCIYFFFVKQKTAYEMRISDWSSDVCSSDLMPVPEWSANLSPDMRGKRVGIPREYRVEGMDPVIEALWQQGVAWARDAGADVVEISLPHTSYALAAYYIIAPAEASSNLARYDGVRYGLRELPDHAGLQAMYAATRAAGFGEEVKRRIVLGTYVLSAGFYDIPEKRRVGKECVSKC